MFFLFTLMILSSFIPNPPDPEKILTEYYVASDTTIVAEGYVFDADLGFPLGGVTVQVEETQKKVTTDRNGYYRIKGLIPGRYILSLKEYPCNLAKQWYHEKEIIVSAYGPNGSPPIPARMDWLISGDENQFKIEYGDELDVSPEERYIHFYLYNAATFEPEKAEQFSIPSGKFELIEYDVKGLYTVKLTGTRKICYFGKKPNSLIWMNLYTVADDRPSKDNVIYVPILSETYQKGMPVWAVAGKLGSINDYPIPPSIKIEIEGSNKSGITGADGTFLIGGLVSGTYNLHFSHPFIDEFDLLKETDENKPLQKYRRDNNIMVFSHYEGEKKHQYRTLFGKVTDIESGLPVQGAHILLNDYDNNYGGFSDDKGYYYIRNIFPKEYALTIKKENYQTRNRQRFPVESGKRGLNVYQYDIQLAPSGYCNDQSTGVVKFKLFKEIEEWPEVGNKIVHLNSGVEKYTDINGIAIFDGLFPGENHFKYVIRYYSGKEKSSEEESTVFIVPFDESARSDTINFRGKSQIRNYYRQNGRFLFGKITDSDGTPLQDISVVILPNHYTTKTDSTGKYDLYLSNGFYEIQVAAETHLLVNDTLSVFESGINRIHGIQRDYTLTKLSKKVKSKNSINGFARDSFTFKPLAGANVYLQGSEYSTTVDSNGAFNFSGVPAGLYKMEVTDLGAEVYTRSVQVGYGKTPDIDSLFCYINPMKLTNYDLTSKFDIINSNKECNAVLSGQITYSPSGVPVTGTPVFLVESGVVDPDSFYSVTSYDGHFIFNVPSGVYTISSKSYISSLFEEEIQLKRSKQKKAFSLQECYTEECNPPTGKLDFTFRDIKTSRRIPNTTVLFHQNLKKLNADLFYTSSNDGSLAIKEHTFWNASVGFFKSGYKEQTIEYIMDKFRWHMDVFLPPENLDLNYYKRGFPDLFMVKSDHYPDGIGSHFVEPALSLRAPSHVKKAYYFIHGCPFTYWHELLYHDWTKNKYFIDGYYYITVYSPGFKPETKPVLLHLKNQVIYYQAEKYEN